MTHFAEVTNNVLKIHPAFSNVLASAVMAGRKKTDHARGAQTPGARSPRATKFCTVCGPREGDKRKDVFHTEANTTRRTGKDNWNRNETLQGNICSSL